MELKNPLIFDDHASLLLLQRAIFEARFHSAAPGRELPGSPLLADMHQQVVGALLEHYNATADEVASSRLREWLNWEGRTIEAEALVVILREMEPNWSEWDAARQFDVAESVMRPFVHSSDAVTAVVAAVNNK